MSFAFTSIEQQNSVSTNKVENRSSLPIDKAPLT